MSLFSDKKDKVFHFFEEISKIPRGSFHEEQISNYLVEFAKDRDLAYIQDEYFNVVIFKEASKGYENAPTVILQGHMDMVWEKEPDSPHNFEKDPIELVLDGDFLKANKTTLGADNGIALAMILSILDSDDIAHPPLEAVMTVQEETGLLGATNLDASLLRGRYFINIDSEEEGELLISCAGGIRTKLHLPLEWTMIEDDYSVCKVDFYNFKGGHSGGEIDKGRANAILLLGRFLHKLNSTFPFEIFEISGGAKMNAIPRSASATIAVDTKNVEKLKELCEEWKNLYRNEYTNIEDDFKMEVSLTENRETKFVLCQKSKTSLLQLMMILPNSIQSMSFIIDGLVESSLNLGVLVTTDEYAIFEHSVRSSLTSRKEHIVSQLKVLADLFHAKFTSEGDYPAWPPAVESKLRNLFAQTYKEVFQKEMKTSAIHAGVECGIFQEKLNGLDMVSFGPTMYDVHTPSERLSISSTERTYRLLLEVLKKINKPL